MKFKMQDKQNQLIERISDKHLVAGVDIAQQAHGARSINYSGIMVGEPLDFENNEKGFNRLFQWINRLKALKDYSAEIIGMEPTGHY